MIRLRDAFMMATTKLRTRRVRTALTVAIAGLLFGAVLAVALVVGGVFRSIDAMTEKSMAGRYIIGGNQAFQDTGMLMEDPAVIA